MTLPGFDSTRFSHDGEERVVHRRGKGPAVIVIHEIPGITPQVARFATRVADAGFSVFMPSLFGDDGRPMTASYALGQITRACISREFKVLAQRQASPLTEWLRALARHAHQEIGGKGVGAIGMCITGNFALALAMDDAVMAPVLSQPSLPFPGLPGAAAAIHLSDEGLVTLKRRTREGNLRVLGLRFTEDPVCTVARFDTLRRELGPAFEAIEIDSSSGNPHGIPRSAHSVVTTHLVDESGHPTRAALERVISFFHGQLDGPAEPRE